MNKSLMTYEEFLERCDDTNGLELSVERYIRLIENWEEVREWDTWGDTCGLCREYYKGRGSCDECPLILMDEGCNSMSLWRKMWLCLTEGKYKESKEYAEEILSYLWQALLYQHPIIAKRFVEEEVIREGS